MVHTLHGPWTTAARRLYKRLDTAVHLVAISEAQQHDEPGARYADTIHNGIDLDAYPVGETRDDFLVYIGRANPEKAPESAIEVARRAGLPLTMIVKRGEAAERAYWEEVVAPLLGSDVTVFEGIGHEQKVELLGRARAFVFPIRWAEPFGLVMIEAMACGTPVIARPCGAATELVLDGVTGFLHDTVGDLVTAVGLVDSISPAACRNRVVELFSAAAMVTSYERLFRTLVPLRSDRTQTGDRRLRRLTT